MHLSNDLNRIEKKKNSLLKLQFLQTNFTDCSYVKLCSLSLFNYTFHKKHSDKWNFFFYVKISYEQEYNANAPIINWNNFLVIFVKSD